MPVKMSTFGVQDLLARLNEIGGNVDDAAKSTLQKTADDVTARMEKGIAKHRQTGQTQRQLRKDVKVESSGSKYSVKVGFKLPKGLPARYINKGTPTNKPDPFVDRALNKTRIRKQQEAFLKELIK